MRRLAPHTLLRPIAERTTPPRWGRLLRMIAADSDGQADLEWLRGLTAWHARQMLHPDLPVNGGLSMEAFMPPPETLASCTDRLEARLAIDLTRRLPDGLLLVNDKTSMAHSLELRMPFLDRNVLEFALQLPSEFKLRRGQEKYILSKLVRRLPPEIRGRRKYGLQIPTEKPPRELQSFISEALLASSSTPLFQPTRVERRIREVFTNGGNQWLPLWRLTIFALWWDRFIARQGGLQSAA